MLSHFYSQASWSITALEMKIRTSRRFYTPARKTQLPFAADGAHSSCTSQPKAAFSNSVILITPAGQRIPTHRELRQKCNGSQLALATAIGRGQPHQRSSSGPASTIRSIPAAASQEAEAAPQKF